MKRTGRPPLDASGTPSAAVHLKLPADDYDRAERIAKARRESVQDVIRRGLRRMLDEHGSSLET